MKYDFDKIIDRQNTDCVKYDNADEVFGTKDILPMWVADMDFQSPPQVIEAAKQCCEKGVFGYTFRSDEATENFIQWVKKQHDWHIESKSVLSSPGVVTALSLSVRIYTNPKDKILIFTPVYPPFFSVITDNNRELVCSSLIIDNDKYIIDWKDFEEKLKAGVKMIIISNPHNPVGRQWTEEELTRMGNLCIKYGVLILSDEIHSDLALFGHKHTVMASISPEIADITITMMAPSKTFNIAGMMNSVIVISSPQLKEKFEKEVETLHLELGNIFGHVTLKAAYKYGENWLKEMLNYLENNINFVDQFLKKELPQVKMLIPESSFLLWLDFRETCLSHEEIGNLLITKGKVGFNNGEDFGKEGYGFRRMNIGCPLSTVQEGLKRLKAALS